LRVIDADKSDGIEIKVKKTDSILVEKPDDIQIQPQIIDEIRKNRVNKKLSESGVGSINLREGTRCVRKKNTLYDNFV
jgi:hypothetical protein